MSDDKSARDNTEGAPLLPGGEPEQAGTGPQGRYTVDDGGVSPEDVPEENSDSGEAHGGNADDTREQG